MKRTTRLLSICFLLLVSSLSSFGQTELVTNGGFENGNNGWSMFASPPSALPGARSNPTIPHSGSVNMVMGNISGTAANPIIQVLYQDITIPSNAVNAQLSYWYNIYSTFGGGNQQFAVYIATNHNFNTAVIFIGEHTGADSDAAQDSVHYHQAQPTNNLAQFAGQTIQLVFNTRMVDFGNLTFFNIDDVSIIAETTADLAANDNFANRIPITTASTNTSVKNLFATKETGEPNPTGNVGGHSVWWSFTPQTNGILQLTASSFTFNTLLGVYTGASVDALTRIAATNSLATSDGVSRLKIPVFTGIEYEIVVDGAGGAAGTVNLQSSFQVDTNPPVVTILFPSPNQHVTNTTVQVRGGATDNVGVAVVQYRLENAAGTNDYLVADGTNSWTATVSGLVPGTNTIRAIAYDLNGNLSTSVGRTVSYVIVAPLALTISGNGTVTPNYNNAALEIGKSYTITAKPAAGNVFSNWSGDVSGTSPMLTFVMESNLMIQANFTVSPYPAGKGNYAGLFSPDANVSYTNSGFFSAAVTDKGSFTAKVQMMGKTYPFTGQFGVDGSYSNSVRRTLMTPLSVQLTIDFSGNDEITGTISDGVWAAALTANRDTFSRTNPPPYANSKFTLVLPGSDDSSTQPGGHGYGSGKIDALGNIIFAGTLGDGTKVSQRTFLSKEGTWPLFAMPYAGKGLLRGWLTFDTNQPSGDFGGSVDWIKLPQRGKYYTNGFDIARINAVGSFYSFSPGAQIVSWSDGIIVLQEGGLADSIANGLTIGANNKITGTNGLALHFVSGTGLFGGTVRNPANNKPIPVNGAILQKQDAGFGTFLGTNQTGRVFLGAE
jgi:List-Bact-rpt repeat protein/Big-like domain-containing protein